MSHAVDRRRRQGLYYSMMAVRVLCVIGMIFTPLPWALLLLTGAALLPVIGVAIGNAVDRRGERGTAPLGRTDPGTPALTDSQVVPGELDDPGPKPRPQDS
ncbi:hypothetical protein CGZ91_10375 [Parenemella sanctibonifatiensis]|uniref:DUF3099 domain-containing protein n=1 Tax=Parenemella sanctibonifatiensis TaxID=2016505 RepID=A0A255EFK9_9ACTN|nr:hypothetical protein CGZ92_04860 [Parenemella sanctibonifatiensis]OYN89954.1 hypothetical protein CGZ91_10375 [Parenemella sanctibonifatiensis]